MSNFHELSNYITDVPMRFSNKYLSLQVNINTLIDNEDDEDFLQFQPEDYKFNSELIAIEMYELHQKKKLEEAVTNATKIAASNSLSKNNSSHYVPTTFTTHPTTNHHQLNRANQSNNLFHNMISGEILQPQPLNKSVPSPKPPHSNCDKHSSDTITAKLRGNLVNPSEFENTDSSPFDNVELQTIDEIKELNNVFQALNTRSEATTEEELKKFNFRHFN